MNNAGAESKGAIWELKEEQWDFLVKRNLKGTFLATQAVIQHMMDYTYGRMVDMPSMAAKTEELFTSPCCTTKFGVIGFTQSIALELGPHNVTVNAMCPGAVEAELFKKGVAGTAKLNSNTYEEELQEPPWGA